MPASCVSSSRPRATAVSLLLTGLLIASGSWPAPSAAAEPDLTGPAPMPTRSGVPKGEGQPAPSDPTGRLFVTYRPGSSPDQRRAVRATERLELVADVPLPDTELVKPAGGLGALAAAATSLEHRPEVASVEREYRRHVFAGPTGEPFSDSSGP